MANAENYILVHDLLFKLGKPTKTHIQSVHFLLVSPESFEPVVFCMFHGSLLAGYIILSTQTIL